MGQVDNLGKEDPEGSRHERLSSRRRLKLRVELDVTNTSQRTDVMVLGITLRCSRIVY